MRNWRCLLPTAHLSRIAVMVDRALAQEKSIPPDVVRLWQHHNNNGWRQFDRGNYDKAAERFDLAIKEVLPFASVDRRLLARSYCDLARASTIRNAMPKPSRSPNGRSASASRTRRPSPTPCSNACTSWP